MLLCYGKYLPNPPSQAQQRICFYAQLPASIGGAGATSTAEEDQPSAAELEAYGVTADFQDFVRSLTYSTFRCRADQRPRTRVMPAKLGAGRAS